MIFNAESGSYSLSIGYSLTGFSARLIRAIHYRLLPATASYSLVGGAITATVKVPPIAVLNASSYSLTGFDSFVHRSRVINFNASPAAFNYSLDFILEGYPVTSKAPIVRQLTLEASANEFLISGSSAALNFYIPQILEASPASYSFDGVNASILRDVYVLESNSSSYQLSGSDALLIKPRDIVLNAEGFTLTFSLDDFILNIFEAATLVHRYLRSLSTEYSLTGYIANDPTLTLESASYSLQTNEASLVPVRYLCPELFSYSVDMQLARMSRQARYPNPQFVLYDTIYGDEGQFIGTMKAVDMSNKFDIETGRFVKILSNKTVMSL